MPEFIIKIISYYGANEHWLYPSIQLVGLVLLTLVLNRNYKRVSSFLSMNSVIGYLFLRAFYLPLLGLIYFSCFRLVVPYLTRYLHVSLVNVEMDSIYQVVVLAIFIWFVGRFTSMVKEYLLSSELVQSALNEKMIYFIFELFYWTLILIFVLGGLSILEVEIADTLHTIGKGVIIWSFTFIFLYTLHVGLKENIRVFSEKGEFLASVLFQAVSLPLLVVVLGTGGIFFIQMTSLRNYTIFQQLRLRDLIIPTFFWAVFRVSTLVEREFLLGKLTRHYPDKTRVQAIGKLTRVVTMLVALLFLFSDKIQHVKSALSWVGGASAIVVGVAAQAIIGNYLSGFVMHFEGNYKVGDWIYSTDKNIEGIVEYMGMRTTTLRTLDKRLLYVPNSFFSKANIVNATKMTNRRIDDVVPIERVHHTVLNDITHDIREMLQAHPDLDHYQAVMANLVEFGPAALNVAIRAFTKTKDLKNFRNVRQDVLLKVMEIIEKHEAMLAPTSYYELRKGKKPLMEEAGE